MNLDMEFGKCSIGKMVSSNLSKRCDLYPRVEYSTGISGEYWMKFLGKIVIFWCETLYSSSSNRVKCLRVVS